MFKVSLSYITFISLSLSAADCTNSYLVQGCDKVSFNVGSDMQISQYRVIKDRDADGVSDNIDKCLDTKSGVSIDANGCEVVKQEIEKIAQTSQATLTKTQECTIVDGKITGSECTNITDLLINFENNSYIIEEDSFAIIEEFANFLKENDVYSVEIVGYTSSIGDDEYNMKLSQQRAEAVSNALIQYGVSSDRLESIGKGEADPIATNESEDGRAKNRRIEAKFSKMEMLND
ncbi:MAG: OmpA family protein [Campylobacterota bacterium]|nr:OmpA family protein [Campylobacterota bacterium]